MFDQARGAYQRFEQWRGTIGLSDLVKCPQQFETDRFDHAAGTGHRFFAEQAIVFAGHQIAQHRAHARQIAGIVGHRRAQWICADDSVRQGRTSEIHGMAIEQ